jgi:tRNA pseudouridine38-40 synthase
VTLFEDAGRGLGERRGLGDERARVKLVVAFEGTKFRGFAASEGQRTVAGVLTQALAKVLRHDVEITCAGRTDAGVHAWGQVVTFDARPDVDVEKVQQAVSAMLGPEVVVREATVVDAAFDARRDARWRSYRYTILNRPVPDPFLARTSWWVRDELDLAAMRAAADPFLGEHDFASFCRKGPEGSSSVRRVLDSRWHDLGEGVLRYDIRASSFCWQMVRSIVGTLVEVGQGRRRPGDMLTILRALDRGAAGAIAPPHGLCLWEVGYERASVPDPTPVTSSTR